MRQRRVRGIEERLLPFNDLILQSEAGSRDSLVELSPLCDNSERILVPASDIRHSRWYQRTSPRYLLPGGFERVYAEIGCGRGLFINAMATEDPEGLYIGAEGCKTIIIRGLEKTRAAGLQNTRYIDAFVNDAEEAFGEETLDGIMLNFSDPWPKDRHADRRLTSPSKADAYLRVLKPGGFVSFKTDSQPFFNYSIDTFTDAGFLVAGPACDIANAAYSNAYIIEKAARTPTEYELKFRAQDKPIYQLTAVKRII